MDGLRQLLPTAEDSSERAAILLQLAVCLRGLGQSAEARDAIRSVYGLVGENAQILVPALAMESTLDQDTGRWGESLSALDRALALVDLTEDEDLRADIDRKRGIALYELSRPKEALPLLKRAAVKDDEKSRVLYYLGRCLCDLGDPANSASSLCQALALDLDAVYQPSAHYVLGIAFHAQGESARAVPELEWCLQHDVRGLVARWRVLAALVQASKALAQEKDADRYAKMLRDLDNGKP